MLINMPMETVNVNIVVDVMKALSERSLKGNAWLMDDSTSGSVGQGTDSLKTACRPGDLLRWKAYPVDLQAGVSILSVSFGQDECHRNGTAQQLPPHLNTWEGIVPYLEAQEYPYRLALQMGKGRDSVMELDTPSLLVNGCPHYITKQNEGGRT